MDKPATLPAVRSSRRGWLRFSLRTTIIAVTVLSVLLGTICNRAKRQRRAVEEIRAAGGDVAYDYQFDSTGVVSNRGASLPGPQWLIGLVGVDYFATVEYADINVVKGHDDAAAILGQLPHLRLVCLSGNAVTDSTVGHLRHLTDLRGLTIWNASDNLTDAGWAPLEQFARLDMLTLTGPHVNDSTLSHVKSLTDLRTLQLIRTDITDAGLENLDRLVKLEFVTLQGRHVTDACVQHFKRLRRLAYLDLRESSLTESGIEALKRSFPNSEIHGP